MNRLVAKTVDEAVIALTLFREWRPFYYSGKVFYLVQEDSECYRIYRTKKYAADYASAVDRDCIRVDYN